MRFLKGVFYETVLKRIPTVKCVTRQCKDFDSESLAPRVLCDPDLWWREANDVPGSPDVRNYSSRA